MDNLNLFQETNCYLNSSFKFKEHGGGDTKLRYLDMDDNGDDIFPIE